MSSEKSPYGKGVPKPWSKSRKKIYKQPLPSKKDLIRNYKKGRRVKP